MPGKSNRKPRESRPPGADKPSVPPGRREFKALLAEFGQQEHMRRLLRRRFGEGADDSRPLRFMVTVALDGGEVRDAARDSDPADERADENAGLDAALAEARERGRALAASILAGKDMLSADEIGGLLGMSRVTVNERRKK